MSGPGTHGIFKKLNCRLRFTLNSRSLERETASQGLFNGSLSGVARTSRLKNEISEGVNRRFLENLKFPTSLI